MEHKFQVLEVGTGYSLPFWPETGKDFSCFV